MTRPGALARLLAPALAGLATLAPAADDLMGFMPDGGRGLFLQVFADPEDQMAQLGQALDVTERTVAITAAAPDLAPRARDTLAAYLAAIAPLDLPAGTDIAAILPPDGKDHAVAQCQSCHSLFSGYLMHRRDRTGWLAIFNSPFHVKIPMTETEQAIFADYSAINMPMRFQDVPPEYRF